MSRYLKRMLLADEYVIHIARLHWAIYSFGIIMLASGFLMGNYGRRVANDYLGTTTADLVDMPLTVLAIFTVLIGAMHMIFAFLRQISTEMVVTNQRVFLKKGFFGAQIFQTMIVKVTSVNIDQTMIGRMLGYGNVTVLASGGDLPEIDHIAEPYHFYSHVMRTVREVFKPEMEEFKEYPPALDHEKVRQIRTGTGGLDDES